MSWGFDSEYIALEDKLRKAKAGDHFELCLVDSGSEKLDSVLAFYETVTSRPQGVGVHIHSYWSLTDASVLVWLAGDTRTLRHGAWIHFRELVRKRARRSDFQRLLDSLEEGNASSESSPDEENYAQVERLVKKHLPPHLLNRRVWAGELAERNVINPAALEINRAAGQTPAPKSNSPKEALI